MLEALLAALLLNPPATADVPVITPEQAKDHIGQEVEVQGQVAEVGLSKDGKTLFLNFGARYPNQVFKAVIVSRSLQSFPEASFWQGMTIRVRGKIQLNTAEGKPVIILERQEQVTIDSSTTPPQGAMPGGIEGGSARSSAELGGASTGPVKHNDSAPRPIKITKPQYPAEAYAKKIEGVVVVEILIDSQGRVVRAHVIQSIPLLDAAALQTVYQWRFKPAMKDGHPVPTIAHAPVAFRLY